MKIGIITLLGHFNYGNRLQNYALQEFLSKYNCIVETIWFTDNDCFGFLPEISLRKKFFSKIYFKELIKYILNWKNFREKKIETENTYGIECVRQYNIKKFSDKYININYKYRIKDAINKSERYDIFKEKLNKEYDYFIVGSDQIWYPDLTFYYIKFLRFTEKNKRIAYAPSLGISNILLKGKKLDILKQGYKDFESISVREEKGAKILHELIGKKLPVLVDPTILLSKEKWQSMSMKPEWYIGEKYILTYFLGEPSTIIKKIAKKNNYKIYNLMDKNNFNLYTSRVEEFLYLIENAQLVCTDSFHGTVFSIIFNVPFLVVNRNDKNMLDMTSRIDTLLDLFNYQDRYIVNGKCDLSDEEILNMDFSNVKAIQEREIARSTEYIKKALNLE